MLQSPSVNVIVRLAAWMELLVRSNGVVQHASAEYMYVDGMKGSRSGWRLHKLRVIERLGKFYKAKMIIVIAFPNATSTRCVYR
jgi:hypothetical protein